MSSSMGVSTALGLPTTGSYAALTNSAHADLTNSLDSHSPDNSDLYRAPGSEYDYEMSP